MKKEFYKESLEFNADFKFTCGENILSNLYSLMESARLYILGYGECQTYTDAWL